MKLYMYCMYLHIYIFGLIKSRRGMELCEGRKGRSESAASVRSMQRHALQTAPTPRRDSKLANTFMPGRLGG
jgi:hypothetical protein